MDDIQGGAPLTPNTQATEHCEKPRKVRRVGTMTMGVALIIVGVAICATLIMPSLDLMMLVKLAPLVLVALGTEIVIAACVNRTDKLKYDGLSIFMCMLLIFFSMCAAFIPTLFAYIGPQAEVASKAIAMQISDELYDEKAQLPKIADARVNVSFRTPHEFTGKEAIKDLAPTDDVYVYIKLGDSYVDKKAFAQDADKIYKVLCDIRGSQVRMGIMSAKTEENSYYEMELYGKFSAGLADEDKIGMVSTMVYDEEYDDYINMREANNRALNREKEQKQHAEQMERELQTASDEAKRMTEAASSEAQRILDEANSQATQARDSASSEVQRILDAASSQAVHISGN